MPSRALRHVWLVFVLFFNFLWSTSCDYSNEKKIFYFSLSLSFEHVACLDVYMQVYISNKITAYMYM